MQSLKNKSKIILRVGLGITFLGIGYYVLQNPAGWGGSIAPWAANLLPFPVETMMTITGIFDVIVGAMLILGIFTHIVALLGFLHIALVVLAIGINPIAVRDIGLAFAALSLAISQWPERKIGNY